MNRLVLIGAGGHGKVAADTARDAGWREIVFVDDAYPERTMNGTWPIVGRPGEGVMGDLFLTVGANAARARLWTELAIADSPVIAHPTAVISPDATLAPGVLAVAGTIVNAGARIGHGVILNTACSVDHDCLVGEFAHVSPGARLAGGVTVGARSWIGIGAVVRQGIRIGDDVVVGAGAAVVDDIDDGATVGGVPARPL